MHSQFFDSILKFHVISIAKSSQKVLDKSYKSGVFCTKKLATSMVASLIITKLRFFLKIVQLLRKS